MQDTFTQKLKAGLQGEEIARVYLESLGHDTTGASLPPTHTLQHLRTGDLTVNGALVEVKLDILSAKTGNIVIEHQSLRTHTAPYYIYILPAFYKTTQQQLQHLVDIHPDKIKMGDDLRDGTKVKIDSIWFRETFTRL